MIKYVDMYVEDSINGYDIKDYMLELLALSNCQICSLFIFYEGGHTARHTIEISRARGYEELDYPGREIKISKNDNGLIRLAYEKKKAIIVEGKEIVTLEGVKYNTLFKQTKKEYYLPVFKKRGTEVIGCVYLGSYSKNNSFLESQQEADLTRNILADISQKLWCEVAMMQDTQKVLDDVRLFYEIIKEKELCMDNHPYNVAAWAEEMGVKMGLDHARIVSLYTAGILHDIGKIFIDKAILYKESKLTSDEYEEIKKHSQYGYNISLSLLSGVECFKNIPFIIKAVHERYDGSGYPDGLKGDDIPLESRILSVADAVDVMQMDTHYKKAKTAIEIIQELKANSGKQFDPRIVDIMVGLLARKADISRVFGLDSIIPCTLVVYSKDRVLPIDGTMVNQGSYYHFRSFKYNFNKDVDIATVTDVGMYVEQHNNILEFNLKVKSFDQNNAYIKELIPKVSMNSFNVMWNLKGSFQSFSNGNYAIQIVKISADSLIFLVEDSHGIEKTDLSGVVSINFSEEKVLKVWGNIIKMIPKANKKIYFFKFANMSENVRDKIFRELFRRQIELRRMASVIERGSRQV